jgi:hypothetical protein
LGETESFGTVASSGPIVSASGDRWAWSIGVIIMGRDATLFTTNPTWTTLELNPGFISRSWWLTTWAMALPKYHLNHRKTLGGGE